MGNMDDPPQDGSRQSITMAVFVSAIVQSSTAEGRRLFFVLSLV